MIAITDASNRYV